MLRLLKTKCGNCSSVHGMQLFLPLKQQHILEREIVNKGLFSSAPPARPALTRRDYPQRGNALRHVEFYQTAHLHDVVIFPERRWISIFTNTGFRGEGSWVSRDWAVHERASFPCELPVWSPLPGPVQADRRAGPPHARTPKVTLIIMFGSFLCMWAAGLQTGGLASCLPLQMCSLFVFFLRR